MSTSQLHNPLSPLGAGILDQWLSHEIRPDVTRWRVLCGCHVGRTAAECWAVCLPGHVASIVRSAALLRPWLRIFLLPRRWTATHTAHNGDPVDLMFYRNIDRPCSARNHARPSRDELCVMWLCACHTVASLQPYLGTTQTILPTVVHHPGKMLGELCYQLFKSNLGVGLMCQRKRNQPSIWEIYRPTEKSPFNPSKCTYLRGEILLLVDQLFRHLERFEK